MNQQDYSHSIESIAVAEAAGAGRAATIHALIATQSAVNPDAIAVVHGDRALTYGNLHTRSNQLARRLQALGVKCGELVGIYVERSTDMLVALLGVLKAGGAYVPLDPAYPADRIGFMLEDSHLGFVLSQSALQASLPDHGATVVCLDGDWPSIATESSEPLTEAVDGNDLAYVIYTSGSTGRPKGVEIPHRAVVNFLRSMAREPGMTAADRLLAVTTLSFDIAGLELYLPLTVGARVVIAGRAEATDGNSLARLIETHEISVMQATPATWRLLLEAEWAGRPGLRIFCGGETLTRDLAERLLPRCAQLWNLYGPTETTIWSTLHRVSTGAGAVPIGHPIAETEILVLDDSLNPVQPGTPGELYIGGAGLARGYRSRTELTAERFVPHPVPNPPGARAYRTGDLVKQLADGALEHLGRVDFQVKVRGFRIELGEIEAALEQQASVRQGVVLAREDVPGEKRLVAYVLGARDQSPNARQLRESLAATLPDYMIPGYYVFLDAFPLTPNGKVDRNAFPAPDASRPELAESYVAPRDQNEERLAGIWADVLRLDNVGIYDDFFELGGDSLKVAQVATRVRALFGVDIPVRAVFENRTVARLVPIVMAADAEDFRAHELPISDVRREATIPLTFAQERVWFLHQVCPENLAYNFHSTVEFKGRLNVPALEQVLGEILRRHESYRSSFPTVDGRPVQVVHDAEAYALQVVDLTDHPQDAREAAAKAWMDQDFKRRFDLARLPLVRWTLLRMGELNNVLVHTEHHLVHDGWSFNVFLRELVALYTAFAAGKPSPLPELPVQFAEFATWQRRWMQGEVSDRQLAYWKRRFPTVPPLLELPTRGARPATQTFRGTSLRPEIPIDLCNGLRALSRKQGSTLFMTMLAAFIALLHRYTGEPDVAVGTFFANRRSPESEGLIGMILNNVVIRAALDANPSASELIEQVRDLVLEAAAHQDVPFDRVVETVQPRRDLSMNPLFQIMFSFHDEPMPETLMPGLDVKLTPVISNGSAKFDLGVIGIPHSSQHIGLQQGCEQDGLTMIWEHNTDIFETESIARMIEHYKILLRGIVDDPQQRISELPLCTQAERQNILIDWNRNDADHPLDRSLSELVAAQANATPDAIAVEFESTRLSYRELEKRSNQLANHLRAMGVGRDVLVGICVGRSAQMLVGLLGILKTGAAYVPIDPMFPADRQAFMLEDAGIKFLVTDSSSAARLPSIVAAPVSLDADADAIAGQPADLQWSERPGPEDTAYVIYTSGSTGRPKGVRIPNRALVNLLQSMRVRPGLGSRDRLFAVTTLSFDIAGLELYLPLIVGACVIVGSRAVATNGERLAVELESTGATVMQATPTTWQMLIDAGWKGDPGLTALCGGEALPRALSELLRPRVRKLWNMYGPTETTIWSTIHEVGAGSGSVPIGRPIGNTLIYLLDRYGQVVPTGISGELCIGGAGVAHGYLNRPELSAEKFIDFPLDSGGTARVYRTGDLARYRSDGTLECLGRTDHQIKLRGFRIELGEIEALLDRIPGITQSVVIAREDVPGDVRLVAYVVPGADTPVDTCELAAVLQRALPDYMIPTAWVSLDSMPLTPNGKVDRRALPTPSGERQPRTATYIPARDENERLLTEIWEQLLGVTPVGVRDDFFDVGGHSLLAVRLVTQIEARTGKRISLAALLHGRTIEHVAAALRGDERPKSVPGFVVRQTGGAKLPFFAVGSHPRYAEIPRILGADRPFYQLDAYALQSERMTSGLKAFTRIEQFAMYYLDLIREVQPIGPYYLGGGCEGAYIAFELATRLQQMGQEVGCLIMWIPPALSESRGLSLRRFAWFHSALRLRYLATGGAPRNNVQALRVLLEHEKIEYRFLQALCAYAPRASYRGEITLVRTAISPAPAPADINTQWSKRATKGAHVHVVPGEHSTWLRDHLDDFTDVLRNRLNASHAQVTSA